MALRPALEELCLLGNQFGDLGIVVLVAPPAPPAGAPLPTTGGLTRLKRLYLLNTQITDAGFAALAVALDNGAPPALEDLFLRCASVSAAAEEAVRAALAWPRAAVPSSS